MWRRCETTRRGPDDTLPAQLERAGYAASQVDIAVISHLHIFLGVEDGDMATLTQVADRSIWILAVDVLILIALPTAAVTLVLRTRRARHEPDRATPHPTPPNHEGVPRRV